MKKLISIMFALICAFSFVNAQESKDSIPNEQIIVNKEYDENGNLIRFDSTFIHHWLGDTTFHFNFDDKQFFGNEFSSMDELIKLFFNDSSRQHLIFPHNFQTLPFEDDFFNHFNFLYHDSTFMKEFKFDSVQPNNHNFVFPDFGLFEKEFEEQFNRMPFYEFQSPEQKQEWEELMDQHRKEMEEFRKRWKEN